MNDILKKVVVELARVILAGLLAALGLEASGCVAIGEHSSSAPFSSISKEAN